MSSGGGGAQGETRYNWNPIMEQFWGGNAQNPGGLLGRATDAASQPRQSYTGERFAPLTYDQMAAGSNIRSLNDLSTNTINASNAGRSSIINTLGGQYLNGPNSNPFAQLSTAGMNPYIGGNEYMGESPAFNSMLADTMGDMAQGYQQGTSAELTRLMNMSGALGGSAHLNALQNNQAALAKAMGQQANQMRSAQFDKSAQLREAELGRGFQNYTGALDRGSQAWEGERGRQMQGIGYGQNEQGLALDRANAQLGVGQMFQGQDQKNRDFQYDQWLQQQNYPFTTMNWLANLYGQAMGGGGMNQSVYGGGGANPWLGAGLAAASIFGGK